MLYFDSSDKIKTWSSEEVIVPYRDPSRNNTVHRYFIDFYVETTDGNTYLIEVKPHRQTQIPAKPKRVTKKYIQAVQTYVQNQAKWEQATKYAEAKGWEFLVLTENELKGII